MLKIGTCAVAVALSALGLAALAQTGTADGDWRYYGGDAQSTKYSPLDRINRENAGKLATAWTWKAQNFGRARIRITKLRRSR